MVAAADLVPRCELPATLEPRSCDDTMHLTRPSGPKLESCFDQSSRRHATLGDRVYDDNGPRETVLHDGFISQISTTGNQGIIRRLDTPSTVRVIYGVGPYVNEGTPIIIRRNNLYGSVGTLKCALCRSRNKKVSLILQSVLTMS